MSSGQMCHQPNGTNAMHPIPRPFSIAPAIFHAYPGPPSENLPQSLEKEARLHAILQNRHAHQAAVKDNIISLIEQEAERLILVAKTELETRKDEDAKVIDVLMERRRAVEVKWSAEEMMKRMKTPRRDGTHLKEYEVGEQDLKFWDGRRKPGEEGRDSHVATGIRRSGTSGSRSGPQIKRDLNFALQELIGTGVWYLNGYDVHASGIRQEYEQALKRGAERVGLGMDAQHKTQSITTGNQGSLATAGILKFKGDADPHSLEGIRRSISGSANSTDATKTSISSENLTRNAASGPSRAVRFTDDIQPKSPNTSDYDKSPSDASAGTKDVHVLSTGPSRTSPPPIDPQAPRTVSSVYEYRQMTCWWWNQGHCRKPANQCAFKHGVSPYGIAPDPNKKHP